MKRIFLAAAAAWAIASPAPADPSASRAVWERHVAAATSGDLDAVMADFAADSAIVTEAGVLSGPAEIRGFFEELLAGLTPEVIETIVVNDEVVHDDVVVSNFTIGALGLTFHDVAVVDDDRIRLLATRSYPAE